MDKAAECAQADDEVIALKKRRKDAFRCQNSELRLDPEQRLCEKYDSTSIAKFDVAEPESMGFRVLDDCAEEHQQ